MISRCPCRIIPFLCFLFIFFLPLFCHCCHNTGDHFVENTQTRRRAPETTASSLTSPLTVWLCSSISQLQETTACSYSQKSFWTPFNFMKKSSDSSGVNIPCICIFHVPFFIYISIQKLAKTDTEEKWCRLPTHPNGLSQLTPTSAGLS